MSGPLKNENLGEPFSFDSILDCQLVIVSCGQCFTKCRFGFSGNKKYSRSTKIKSVLPSLVVAITLSGSTCEKQYDDELLSDDTNDMDVVEVDLSPPGLLQAGPAGLP